MYFNSVVYIFFLAFVFTVYWCLQKRVKLQNLLLLISSYFFYSLWDYRFLSLIILSSFVDFFIGQKISLTEKKAKKKFYLFLSLFVNLGMLGVFKYYDFFVDSFNVLLDSFNLNINIQTLNLILPVGISFYTFQTLSYTIDIYYGKIKPTKNFINFFTFVSFFPQLVAGPIERAKYFLPQIELPRKFNLTLAKDGLKQILWGLFQKVVIADNCAVYVDKIFQNYPNHNGFILFLGAVLFAIQIYCDFAGYSSIAIGSAKLLGIKLMQNFKMPYFSKNISDFWKRWHISLSTWFRDYVYIPLGGNRVGKSLHMRNIFVVFITSGLWHGANWTYLMWGFIHFLLFIPSTLLSYFDIKLSNSKFTSLMVYISTMFSVIIAWIFFRSDTITDAFQYIGNMIIISDRPFQAVMLDYTTDVIDLIVIIISILVLFTFEFISNNKEHGLSICPKNIFLRWSIYLVLSLLVLQYLNGDNAFIYFQF